MYVIIFVASHTSLRTSAIQVVGNDQRRKPASTDTTHVPLKRGLTPQKISTCFCGTFVEALEAFLDLHGAQRS